MQYYCTLWVGNVDVRVSIPCRRLVSYTSYRSVSRDIKSRIEVTSNGKQRDSPIRWQNKAIPGCWQVFSPTRKETSSEAHQGSARFQQHRDASCQVFFFLQGKAPKEIHAILTETLACFLPGHAKDLSAPLYKFIQTQNAAADRLNTGRTSISGTAVDLCDVKCENKI